MASIQFEAVSHRRPGEFDALVGFELTIHDHDVVALVGGHGSGAATTLRLLAGLEIPDHGTIRIDGRDLAGVAPLDRSVALVLPHHGLHLDRTVADHLTFPLLVGGLPLQARRRRLRDVAEQLALGGLLDHLPTELTPSERQRVAFGRAIVRQPEVLLVDEPWSGLAGTDRDLVRDECARRCAEFTMTIVAVVHDPADAHVIADRIVTIDSGVARPEHPVRVLA